MKLVVLLFNFVVGVSAFQQFHWLPRQPKFTTNAVRKGRESLGITTDLEISDLSPRNAYESTIFSSLTKWRGQRIEGYKITKDFPKSVLTSYSKVAKDTFKYIETDAFFRSDSRQQSNHATGDSFECDLYFKPAEPNVASVEELLGQATERIVLKSGHPVTTLDDKWIFTEISSDSRLAAHKLLQLERAFRFLPVISPNITVGAAVVLINGPESEGQRAFNSLRIPEYYELFRRQIPVYIGWVSTRNTFKQLNNLQRDMNNLQTDVKELKTTVGDLIHRFDRLENLVIKVLNDRKP